MSALSSSGAEEPELDRSQSEEELSDDADSGEPATAALRTSRAASSQLAESMSKHLVCPITQELMVDPVLAEDGNTYEGAAIRAWLATKRTSPLDPSCRLSRRRLVSNRAVKQQIEELVASGELEEGMRARYWEVKAACATLQDAQALYGMEFSYDIIHTHLSPTSPP
jgi:hypothetical protein